MSSAWHTFETTQWTVVLAAAQTDSVAAQSALEELSRAYWFPLYAYLRRKGHPAAEAQDLTQEFFATRVVTRRILQGVSPEGGRFRTWLLRSLQNLALNELGKAQAARRGGGVPHVSWELPDGEERYAPDAGTPRSPEAEYDRAWAMTLIQRALARIEEDQVALGRGRIFQFLKPFLTGLSCEASYDEVGRQLEMRGDAVKAAVSRLRKDFGLRLRAEVRRTVSTPDELREELVRLREVLAEAC